MITTSIGTWKKSSLMWHMWKKRFSPLLYATSESLQSYSSFNSSSEMLTFIAVFCLSCQRTIWQIKYLKASSSSFSFYRASKLFGSLNCISECSLKKKKKAWDCSIGFAAFLLQVVITLWHYSSQRIRCVLKKNMHRHYPLCVCSSSVFPEDGWGQDYQLQSFIKGFSPGFPCPDTKVGPPRPNMQAGGGLGVGTGSKGRCWRKAAAGWLILCYWWPAMLPASSLLVQVHTHWLPLVCAGFSLIPVMLAGLQCGHWQDVMDCSLFALAGFEAEDMNAYPHKSKHIYLNRTVSIMYILHSKHPAPEWSQGPLWTCASAVDSCTQKLHLHVTAPPALCPLNPRRPARIPDCWATATGCPGLLAQPIPMGFALLSRSRGQGWEPPVPAPLQQQTGAWGRGRGSIMVQRKTEKLLLSLIYYLQDISGT